MSLDSLLCQTCTIQAVTRTADGAGGQIETWTDKAAGVACRVSVIAGDRRTLNEKNESVYTHSVIMRNREINEHEDRIYWEGKALEIIPPLTPARDGTGQIHHLTVLCREVS